MPAAGDSREHIYSRTSTQKDVEEAASVWEGCGAVGFLMENQVPARTERQGNRRHFAEGLGLVRIIGRIEQTSARLSQVRAIPDEWDESLDARGLDFG